MKTIRFHDAELQNSLFSGLEDRNTGFDSPNIYWFDERDFETILKRCDNEKYQMAGIETRFAKDGEFDDCKLRADYPPTENKWYWKAFANMKEKGVKKLFSATFYKVIESKET